MSLRKRIEKLEQEFFPANRGNGLQWTDIQFAGWVIEKSPEERAALPEFLQAEFAILLKEVERRLADRPAQNDTAKQASETEPAPSGPQST